MSNTREKYLGGTAAPHSIKEDPREGAGEQRGHLAVAGDGLLVSVHDVFGAEAVLRASDLSAGVGVYPVGGQGACERRGRKIIAFAFLSRLFVNLKGGGTHTIKLKYSPLKCK